MTQRGKIIDPSLIPPPKAVPLPKNLPRRTWIYVDNPPAYGIPGCLCGEKTSIMWSEYKDLLWCPMCKQEFTPKHWGVFDGPVLVETAKLIGLDFRRWCLVESKILDEFPTEGPKP